MKVAIKVCEELHRKDLNLAASDYRVLFFLLKKAKFGGKVFVKQKVIAEKTGVLQNHVHNCVKKLVSCQLIEKRTDENFGLYYEFNPDFFQKGKGAEKATKATVYSFPKRKINI